LRNPQNEDIANALRTAGTGLAAAIIVGTIIEDIATAGVGIGDDAASFALAYRIYQLAL